MATIQTRSDYTQITVKHEAHYSYKQLQTLLMQKLGRKLTASQVIIEAERICRAVLEAANE